MAHVPSHCWLRVLRAAFPVPPIEVWWPQYWVRQCCFRRTRLLLVLLLCTVRTFSHHTINRHKIKPAVNKITSYVLHSSILI
jgi:hypothetical protein